MATAIVRVGRGIVLGVGRVGTTVHHSCGAAAIVRRSCRIEFDVGRINTPQQVLATAIVRVGRGIVLDVGRVGAAVHHGCGAASIIVGGQGIVLGVGRVGTAVHHGIPETPHGESVAWIEVVPEDAWIVVAQVPVPSIAATRGRTPPVAEVAGSEEVANVEAAVAARKGRKPKVVRAVAIVGPACCRFQGCPLSTTVAVGTQVCLQCRPLAIGRDMPTRRTQAPSIVYRIPVVQTAIRRQRLRFVARVDDRTVALTTTAALAIDGGCAGCR